PITSLNVSAIFPATPVQSSGNRAEKSPRLNAIRAVSSRLLSTSLFSAREPLPVRRRLGDVAVFIAVRVVRELGSTSRCESGAQDRQPHSRVSRQTLIDYTVFP